MVCRYTHHRPASALDPDACPRFTLSARDDDQSVLSHGGSFLSRHQRRYASSLASGSISASSPFVNGGKLRATTFCSSWATLDAPISADVIWG